MPDSDFQAVTNESLTRLDEIFTIAQTTKAEALDRGDTMIAAAQAQVALLNDEAFVPTFDAALNLTYSSPSSASEPNYSGEGPATIDLSALEATEDFDYSDTEYTALVKNEMQSKLISVLNGNLIVPTAIWDAIYQRALSKVTAQKTAAEWDASNEYGMGWTLPSESTLSLLQIAQEIGNTGAIELIVDQAIGEAKERHADLWLAMTNGNAFEKVWIDHHHATENRVLDAAKAAVQRSVQANELLIKSNDTKLQEYGAKWRTALQAIDSATNRFSSRIQDARTTTISEQARLGYQNLIVDKGLKTEGGVTNLAVERANQAKTAVEALTQVMNFLAATAQGAYAASDVSVGTGTSYSYGESLTLT